jgi:hypothetical protein
VTPLLIVFSKSQVSILIMRSYTILSCWLSLISVSFALPGLNDKYSVVNNANNSTAGNTTCTTGVHMIIARASTEPPGEGIIGAVATTVKSSVPGSD